jgi:hypothetical protein
MNFAVGVFIPIKTILIACDLWGLTGLGDKATADSWAILSMMHSILSIATLLVTFRNQWVRANTVKDKHE